MYPIVEGNPPLSNGLHICILLPAAKLKFAVTVEASITHAAVINKSRLVNMKICKVLIHVYDGTMTQIIYDIS